VQGAPVFDDPSFLSKTHFDASTIKSDLIRIDCGGGKDMQMLAYWPSPGGDGWGKRKGSDRLYLHQNNEYYTGTYLVYKDKIINPYNPKSLNAVYEGSIEFSKALNIILSRDNSGAKGGLCAMEDGPLRNWLGFSTWQEWLDYGFPSPQTIRSSSEYDKDRLYEILGCGAIFIVRVDQVVSLDTRKDEMKEQLGSGMGGIKEVVYRIRRAQMRWCLDTKPQERVVKEAKKAQQVLARQAQQGGALVLHGGNEAPASERAKRKRTLAVENPAVPMNGGASGGGGGRGRNATRRSPKKPKAVFPQAIAQRLDPVNNFFGRMQNLDSTSMDEDALRQERDQLINLWTTTRNELEKAYLWRWSPSAAAASAAAASAAATSTAVVVLPSTAVIVHEPEELD